MARALSMDLRSRVPSAIREGMSCRQAAAHFGISASSAIRWCEREREKATPGRNHKGATADPIVSRRTPR